MKFAVLINSNPDTNPNALTAYRFVEAALLAGHQIVRVFFYKDGVYHAFAYRTLADDELDLSRKWQTLTEQYALDLVVCISAAQRRGLLNEDEAKRQNKRDNDLAEGFRIGGLGQLLEALLEADRFIEF